MVVLYVVMSIILMLVYIILLKKKNYTLMQYYGTIISIAGLLLISFKYPFEGFIVSIYASIIWATYGYVTKQHGIVVNSVFYFIAEIIGIVNWK